MHRHRIAQTGGTLQVKSIFLDFENYRNSSNVNIQTLHSIIAVSTDMNDLEFQELLFPLMELGKHLLSLAYWEDPLKSFMFCSVVTYIICR